MTFAESLRAYADWCDQNPTLLHEGIIDTYGESAAQAKGIMLADPHAKLDLLPGNSIVYLNQQFGTLIVKHVLHKHDVCNQSIVDNKVVAVLKPEFAELVTASLADVAPGWVTA
jgi:hypothetical protein